MMFFFLICISIWTTCTAYFAPLQIPFTFELQDFKAPQRVHFDPDGCGQTFYLSFHTELEMEDDGGIKNESGTILRLSFKRGSQGGGSVNLLSGNDTTGQKFDVSWFQGNCLVPLLIQASDSGTEITITRRNSKAETTVEFKLKYSLYNAKFLTLGGSVTISNYHSVGTYYEPLTVTNVTKRIQFPSDFNSRQSYRLYMLIQPHYPTRKTTSYLRILDKSDSVEFVHLKLTYHEEYDYRLECAIKRADGRYKVMHEYPYAWYADRIFDFPVRAEFTALAVFEFYKGKEILMYLNTILWCKFEPFDTPQVMDHLISDGHILILNYLWT